MAARTESVLSAGTGLVAALVLGVSVLVSGTTISGSALVTGLWWTAYLLYVLVFALDDDILGVRRPWSGRTAVALMFLAGMTVWFLAPDVGWSALLFVVTAGAAAFELPGRALVPLVAAQTIAIAAGSAVAGWAIADLVFQSLAYLAFQGFAVVVVLGARREAESRTELAAAHAELRATSALLESTSRSAERLRIARDLHDVVGHQLTALALELEVATHRTDGQGREHVTRARDIAKELLTDVRAAVGELRETPEDLEQVLRRVVSGLPGLDVDLVVDQAVPLDEERLITVVRCVQEVVTNTLRHAGATRLTISVVADDDGVMIRAHDDGEGTDVVEMGNGLTGMTERVAALDGQLSVDSAPGKGFTVLARVPAP